MTEPQVRETVREWARECDCWDWFGYESPADVLACVHFDDDRVVMGTEADEFFVQLWSCEGSIDCDCCTHHYDYESALAAFHKAEQELLRADE